jgi:hypothetical protein
MGYSGIWHENRIRDFFAVSPVIVNLIGVLLSVPGILDVRA